MRKASQETRERLIEAALDMFGRMGFEAVGTRAIAQAAGVNLAAIKYHFGGKEGLYNAVAAHIAEEIGKAVGPVMEAAQRQAADPSFSPQTARLVLRAILGGFLQLIVANPATENWARFIIREQMTPSPAFDILYDGLMGRAHEFITRMAATAMGIPADSAQAKLTGFALFGQTLVFRVARAAVLRRMEWSEIGPAEMAEIERVVDDAVARLPGPAQGVPADGHATQGERIGGT